MPRKECVPLNFVGTICAQTTVRFALQQSKYDAAGFVAHILREHQRVPKDPLIHRVHILVVKRG